MYNAGDVVVARIQFVDTYEVKTRPALILFREKGNVVVAGITSNPNMAGIQVTEKEGAIVKSVIKTNYIFTISDIMIKKKVFTLSKDKKRKVYDSLKSKLDVLIHS
jgi:mRNA interferase MazF